MHPPGTAVVRHLALNSGAASTTSVENVWELAMQFSWIRFLGTSASWGCVTCST